jgi:HTH-type transcriptional regulator/antitoxin HigA
MINRGWLKAESVREALSVESELTRFFGVASIAEIEILPHAAKKTDTTAPVSTSQLAWIYRVRQIARGMVVARPYSRAALVAASEELKTLLRSPEEARKVPRILAEAGVRFVIVESLKSAKMDGVCFWLNPTSPVIGMSIRFDRIDNFWFVLSHEIEHVLRGHGRTTIVVDAELEGDRAGVGAAVAHDERIANEAAASFCVPNELIDKFIAIKAPVFSQRDVLGFAAMLGVHPGLVVGQLQRKTGRYDLLRDHLVRIRSIVSPGAIVDGWGDVAPVHA